MNALFTNEAPAPIGPFSQAIVVGNTVYCSGQVGIKAGEKEMVKTVEGQTKQIFDNIKAVLTSYNLKLSNIVKTTVFLADMNDFSKMNEVYASYITGIKPARSAVQVARLPLNALVEIECIAVV